MNHFPKKKRAVYEREFTLKHVLQNLQGYRLATGDINPHQLTSSRIAHGDDEGRVYGALITEAGKGSSAHSAPRRHDGDDSPSRGSGRKRRRRRKRRKVAAATADGSDTLSIHQTQNRSSPKPALDEEGEDPQGSSSLRLVTYSGSSSSENEPDHKKLRQKSKSQEEALPIPSVIQEMFEADVSASDHLGKETSPTGYGSSKLGFFESEELSSSEDEVWGGCSAGSIPGSSHTFEPRDVGKKQAAWTTKDSEICLTSYTCWKCSNVGHLPQDCTVQVLTGRGGGGVRARIPRSLQTLYATCREIRSKKGQSCADCGVHSNLACCLDCRSILCDGRGHLASHLLDHISHNTLFSFKLGRLLKCCKSTCEVVSVYDLLVCSHCLGKAFSQHYSMINAIWTPAGLRKIPNALCCEEHFLWHRMNCPNVCEESFISEQKLLSHNHSSGLLSEFYF